MSTEDSSNKDHPDYDPRYDETLEWRTIRLDRFQIDGVWCVFEKVKEPNGPCINYGVQGKVDKGVLIALMHFDTDISLEEKTAVIEECTRKASIMLPVGDKKFNVSETTLDIYQTLKHQYTLPAKQFHGFICGMFYHEELNTIFGYFDHMSPTVVYMGDKIEAAMVYLSTVNPMGVNLIGSLVNIIPKQNELGDEPAQELLSGFIEPETKLRS